MQRASRRRREKNFLVRSDLPARRCCCYCSSSCKSAPSTRRRLLLAVNGSEGEGNPCQSNPKVAQPTSKSAHRLEPLERTLAATKFKVRASQSARVLSTICRMLSPKWLAGGLLACACRTNSAKAFQKCNFRLPRGKQKEITRLNETKLPRTGMLDDDTDHSLENGTALCLALFVSDALADPV